MRLTTSSAPVRTTAASAALTTLLLATSSSPRAPTPRLDGAKPKFMVQDLPAPKAHFLLFTWTRAAQGLRSNGFQPKMEAIGAHALRLRHLVDELPSVDSVTNILGLVEKGSLSFDNLQEPHKSKAERLSKTRVVGAISAGSGSAIALVSDWGDKVSIDAVVTNPSYLVASEQAELELVEHIARKAAADGAEVTLTPGLQVAGDAEFYAAAGFVLAPGEEGRPPIEVEAEGGAPRPTAGEEVTPPVLRYAPSEAKVPVVVSDPSLL